MFFGTAKIIDRGVFNFSASQRWRIFYRNGFIRERWNSVGIDLYFLPLTVTVALAIDT